MVGFHSSFKIVQPHKRYSCMPDFQLMFQGRGKYTPFDLIATQSGVYCTTAAQIKYKIANQMTAAENEPSVELWCKRRDALHAVDEDQYILWEDHSPYGVLSEIAKSGELPGFAWHLTKA